MKKLYSVFFVLAMVLVATSAHAQEDSRDFKSINIGQRPGVGIDLRAKFENARENVEARREILKERTEERKENLETRRETIRTNVEEKREVMQERREEFQRGIAEKRISNVARVISATINRLEKIISRIESRMEKLSAEGIDVTEATRYIAEAKANLGDAKTSVASFVSIDLSSEVAQENFDAVKEAAKEAKSFIRNAHENLRMAVGSLHSERESSEESDE